MPVYKVQVVLPMFTNLPRDVITNTFHFETAAPVSTASLGATVSPLLRTFYRSCYTPGGLANYVNPNTCKVRVYNMADPEPRLPWETTWASMADLQNNTTIPTEVSCVVSMNGAPVPGVPLARQRGRIYFGGLGPGWLTTGTVSTFPTIAAAAISAIDVAAGVFLTAINAVADLEWVVWSPTQGEAYPIVGGHIDNSPDTQRRRSVASTSRNLWS